MKLTVLGSGSSGNCTWLGTSRTSLLIDLGFGPRSLARRMKQAGLENAPVDAILLTHGHADHVKGVACFAERHQVPVFMNIGTREEVPELASLDRWEEFQPGVPFTIGDLTVEPFTVSHDSAQPVGFRFQGEGIRGALATDLGEISMPVANRLQQCDWLVLESNHDEDLLKLGPYPWNLKQRVLSRLGHLSTSEVGRFLSNGFDGQARHLLLAHLSQQNNDPLIALRCARQALLRRARSLFEQCQVHLTHQGKPSIVLNL